MFFADDALLLASSSRDLIQVLRWFSAGMRINTSKSEGMVLRKSWITQHVFFCDPAALRDVEIRTLPAHSEMMMDFYDNKERQ